MRLLAALLVLVATACQQAAPGGRVVVLGLDGMDPQTVDQMMSEGSLPHFAKLREEGAYGKLMSMRPILSPIIWTTIATGKTPDQHGIGHFVAVNQQTGQELPVTSQMRKVKALWNIASDANRKVAVVGYWATWPAETVHGAIVSDHTCYHFLFTDGANGGGEPAGLTYPADLAKEIAPMIRRPGDLTLADVSPFIDVTAEDMKRPFSFDDDLGHFRWARATAETYRTIGLHLWQTEHPDLEMIYIEGTDSVAHLFGHLFRAQNLAGELAEQQKHYGHAVESMYKYADGILGDVMVALDDRTTLVVLSDHGFQLGALPDDPSKLRTMRRVSEQFHRIEGILYVYGNHVKRHARIDQPTLVDVSPTVLTLLGIAPAKDMPGKVLTDAIDLPDPPRTVATFETGTQVATGGPTATDADVDPQVLERLKSLGYIGAQSPRGDRNMAAMHFQAGRYEEARAMFADLVAQNPNDGALHTSLAGALGALGRYDEALKELDAAIKLEPLNPESYHNRAVIYEKQGKKEAAIAEYRSALRYRPDYEPSTRALVRLTGSAASGQPKNAAQQLASKIAARAEDEARRGDYAAAMKTLDEAQKIAPRFPLVYQYRSNVAFLMGDRQTAIAALQKALELEPDNALYQTNLKRLQQTPSTTVK